MLLADLCWGHTLPGGGGSAHLEFSHIIRPLPTIALGVFCAHIAYSASPHLAFPVDAPVCKALRET